MRRQRGTWGIWRERIHRQKQKTKASEIVAVNTIGMEPNDPLAYAPGSEHQIPNMSTLGEHTGWLYI